MRLVASCYMRLAPSCELLQAHPASTCRVEQACYELLQAHPASTHTHTLLPKHCYRHTQRLAIPIHLPL
jgi:hypothetical protein